LKRNSKENQVMTRSRIVNALGAALLLAAAACDKGGGATAQAAPASEGKTTTTTAAAAPEDNAGGGGAIDTAKAREVFNSRCATCHGTAGKGDGPGALTLNPKPRNYTDKAWQASVKDEDIKKTIVYGGAAVGKSPMMPASPDLDSKPQVVEGLVQIVRTFGK
jgi:mono/diheme cytochrome c family protein